MKASDLRQILESLEDSFGDHDVVFQPDGGVDHSAGYVDYDNLDGVFRIEEGN